MSAGRARCLANADLGLVLVAIGAIGFGCRPLFARLGFADGIPPALAGLLTLAPTALLCMPSTIGFLSRKAVSADGWVGALFALLAGVFVAIGSLAYMHALELLTVAATTVIYFSYPLFVVLLGWLISGTRPTGTTLAAALLILAGCSAMVVPGAGTGAALVPVLIAFVAPLSYAVLLLLLAHRLVVLPLLARVGLITLGATLMLVPATGVAGFAAVSDLSRTGWIALAGLVVVCGFVPQLTTTIGVPRAGADRAAIAGGLELVTALAVGSLALRRGHGAPRACRRASDRRGGTDRLALKCPTSRAKPLKAGSLSPVLSPP